MINLKDEAGKKIKLASYNLSVFIFGCALVQTAFGNYRYSSHFHGLQYNFSVASSALIGAIGIYALGKWLVNKELEVK